MCYNNYDEAIIHRNDFDKTLCTTDMQEYDFIKNLGMTSDAFWGEAAEITSKYQVEKILSYMPLTEDYLKQCGAHIL